MKERSPRQYPLDNSAIIHLAAKRKTHTNAFRLTATLNEAVCPETLQEALEHITPRFPTIVAGIQRGFFDYKVVPVKTPPKVQWEKTILAPMTKREIQACAMRVVYSEYQISVECFHSLTDGYGGSIFLNSLLAEYLSLRHASPCAYTEQILDPHDMSSDAEVSDDFIRYASSRKCQANHRKVYNLPPSASADGSVHVAAGAYNTQEMLNAAHSWGVSLTVFLAAVMFQSVIDLQERHMLSKDSFQPIQLMVPINLRRQFESKTLRNFSLYALPCIEPSPKRIPFDALVGMVSKQMEEQTSKQHLTSMISTNVRTQKSPLFRILPLPVKDILLRVIHYFYGERNSALSVSNLGEVTYPDELEQYIERLDFLLTPRRDSSCNCGIISYNGSLYINFTGRSRSMELGHRFFKCLSDIGCRAKIEIA